MPSFFLTPHIYNMQGKVINYEANGIGVINSLGGVGIKLVSTADTYDISLTGEIVYGKMDYGLGYDRQKGTLWIMNSNGSNNRQLTFNNF